MFDLTTYNEYGFVIKFTVDFIYNTANSIVLKGCNWMLVINRHEKTIILYERQQSRFVHCGNVSIK